MDRTVSISFNEPVPWKTALSPPSLSFLLNVLLLLVCSLFILSSFHVIENQKIFQQITATKSSTASPKITTTTLDALSRARKTKTYYDFERFYQNGTVKVPQKEASRRFFYIDLGCFDARGIDHFIHFHQEEIARHGTLTVITFEPDPINLSACQRSEQRHNKTPHVFVEAAAWIYDGKVRYAIEKGQKSRLDASSALSVSSIDFSQWLKNQVREEDYVYVKFTVEGAEIGILEKMVTDRTLSLVDYLDIEWNDALSPDFEPRRVSLECMLDNFGMDFLYMINPADSRHAFNSGERYSSVPKTRDWRLKDDSIRFHYKTRMEVADLVVKRHKRESLNQQQKLAQAIQLI